MVPVWDGSPEDWEDYQIRSGIYCRGVDKWKVGQRISNLIQSLTGKAWDSITNLSEPERENLQQDLPSFHAYLQQACLPTAIPELGRRFREWLKFKRFRKETMRTYIRRYRLGLNKLETSMRVVDGKIPRLEQLRKAIAVQKVIVKAKLTSRNPPFLKSSIPSKGTGSVGSKDSVKSKASTSKPKATTSEPKVSTSKSKASKPNPKAMTRNWTLGGTLLPVRKNGNGQRMKMKRRNQRF